MAITGAQKQERYRARRAQEGKTLLRVWIAGDLAEALATEAAALDITPAEHLETILREKQSRQIETEDERHTD